MDTFITKYRPTKFEDVLGQQKAVQALEKAIAAKRTQTILITGPVGVGKTSLARIAAKAAGCQPEEVLEVDAATNTSIDDMRRVAESMMYFPMVGKSKAIILDEAQALSKAAVQSLLKPFEEPPKFSYWFMCTTEPSKIPAAIKSRCLHINLKPVALPILTALLTKVWKAEKFKSKPEIVVLCAEEAQGSPRQALINLAVCAEAKTIEDAKELLQSAADTPIAVDLARALINKSGWRDIQKMLARMNEEKLNAESIRQVIRAYMTSIALKVPGGATLTRALAILEAFETPCNPMDGISPIVIGCAKVMA